MRWRIRVDDLRRMGIDKALEQAKCYARLKADRTLKKLDENFDLAFIPFLIAMTLFMVLFFRIALELMGVQIYVYMR